MDALRLAGHARVIPAAEHAGGRKTRAATSAAALLLRDLSAFDSAEMRLFAADYATNSISCPTLGVKCQIVDSTIRKYEDFECFVRTLAASLMTT